MFDSTIRPQHVFERDYKVVQDLVVWGNSQLSCLTSSHTWEYGIVGSFLE